MTFNVGIYCSMYTNTILIDDGINMIQTLTFKTYYVSDFDEMFERIKAKANGDLNCACLCTINYYSNDIKKTFMKSALAHGFKKVEIINKITAKYLYGILETNYKVKNGDVIWACDNDSDDYCCCSMWQKVNGKTKHVKFLQNSYQDETIFFDNVVQHFNATPNVILFHKNYLKLDQNLIKKIFPDCQIFGCHFNALAGALGKAHIMAKNLNMAHADAYSLLEKPMSIKLGRKEIIHFPTLTTIPCSHSVIINTTEDENVIYVDCNTFNSFVEESFCIPMNDKFLFSLHVDTNGIISTEIQSLTFNDDSNSGRQKSILNHEKSYFISKEIGSVKVFHELSSNYHYLVGISFGHLTCCAALNRRNGIEVIALDNTGERLLPCYVGFDERNEKCGQLVIDRLQHHQESTVFDIKYMLGKKFEDVRINRYEKELLKQPEEIVAILLKHIKGKTEEYQSAELFECLITVPLAFSDSQKDAIKVAAILAGWKIVHLLPEPIAATFAYFIEKPIINFSTIFLFDLGGKTLDICIFKAINNEIKIISNSGDSTLGGKDFDQVLADYIRHKIKKLYNVSVAESKEHKFMQKCQRMKENLSVIEKDCLDVEEVITSLEEFLEITREEFEHLVVELLDQIKICVMNALNEINYIPADINKVFYVGGGCRMPIIRKLLKECFPFSEHCYNEQPDEIVAIGAAYYACYQTMISKPLSTSKSIYGLILPKKVFDRRNSF